MTSQVANQVVLEMMQPLINESRILCTDNFYTSVGLAPDLLEKKTHLIETLRKNRKFNPRAETGKIKKRNNGNA